MYTKSIFAFLLASSIGWNAFAEEAISGCAAFTADARYYDLLFFDELSDRQTEFSIPSQYFPFYFQRKGEVRTARTHNFLFNFDDFASATKSQERKLGVDFDNIISTVMRFSRLDRPLERTARSMLSSDPIQPKLPADIQGPAGLRWLDTEYSSASEKPDRDHFIAYNGAGDVISYLICSSPENPTYARPGCTQRFHAEGFIITASYDRSYMDEWKYVQEGVASFLSCGKAQAAAQKE